MSNPRSIKKLLILSLVIFLGVLFVPLSLGAKQTKSNNVQSGVTLELSSAHAFNLGDASEVTKALQGQTSASAWIERMNGVFRNLLNVIAIVILLIAAFASILRINVDTYAIKKVLPQIIIGIVAANLSMTLFIVASRIVDSIQAVGLFKPIGAILNADFVLNGAVNSFSSAFGGGGWFAGAKAIIGVVTALISGVLAGYAVLIVGIIMLIMFGMLIVINLILSFRPYIIYLAAAVAPLAIGASFFPPTQPLFKKWMNIAVAWFTLPLVVAFMIHLVELVDTSGTFIPNQGAISGIIGFLIPTALRGAVLFLAIRYPFMVEKDVTGAIGKLGSYAGNWGQRVAASKATRLYDSNKGLMKGARNRALGALQGARDGRELNKRELQTLTNSKRTTLASQTGAAGENFRRLSAARQNAAARAAVNEDLISVRGNDALARRLFKEEYASGSMKGFRQYDPRYRTNMTVASILTMPMGVSIALKNRGEVEKAKGEKTSQKVLLYGLGQQAEALRGRYAQQSYRGDILKADTENMDDPDQLKEHVNWPALMRKVARLERDANLRERGEAYNDLDEAGQNLENQNAAQRAIERIEEADTSAEGSEIFRRAFPGLSDSEAKELEHIQRKLLREQRRTSLSWAGRDDAQGQPLPDETQSAFRRRVNRDRFRQDMMSDMMGENRNRPGAGSGAIEDEEDETRPAAGATDERVAGYLRELVGLQRGGLNVKNLSQISSRAAALGLDATHIQQIDHASDSSVGQIEWLLKRAGKDDEQVKKSLGDIRKAGVAQLGGVKETTVGQISDKAIAAELSKEFDNLASHQIGKIVVMANTDIAQQTQRYAEHMTNKVAANPQAIPEIKVACEQVVKGSLGIDSTISPEMITNAKKTISNYIPVKPENIDEKVAMHVNNGADVLASRGY